jgi:DNA mismatch repair protein MutS
MSKEPDQDILVDVMKISKEFESIKEMDEANKNLETSLNEISNPKSLIFHEEESKIKLLLGRLVPESNIKIKDTVYSDLEVFYNYKFKEDNTLFSVLDNSITIWGKYYLKEILSNPTSNVDILKQRQKIIKTLLNNNALTISLKNKLSELNELDQHILWFWDQGDDINTIYEMVFFDFYQMDHINFFINTQATILNYMNLYKIYWNPIMTIMIPLLAIIVPMVLMKLLGQNIPLKFLWSMLGQIWQKTDVLPTNFKYLTMFSTGIWIFFYLQNIYYSGSAAYNTHKVINVLHQKINYIAKMVIVSHELLELIPPDLMSFDITQMNLQKMFLDPVFNNKPGWLTHKGNILSTYYKFNISKTSILPYTKFIGELDYYLGLIKWIQFSKDSGQNTTFVNYLMNENKPKIEIKDLWDPSLLTQINTNSNSTPNSKKIITNDLNLNHTRNLLITGPNAAGKSTYLKSLAICVLMAQTIGVVPSNMMNMTPFHVINTYLNIPDCLGKSSLFEAEMYRTKEHLEMIGKLGKDEFSFVIMDEIFSSTNYVEGYAGAYAIIKKLINSNNSISIITTHYTDLSKLEDDTKKIHYKNNKKYCRYLIKNFKMTCQKNIDDMGEISFYFPYRIQPGISNQYIALDILKKNRFDSEIIDEALRIVSETLKNQK